MNTEKQVVAASVSTAKMKMCIQKNWLFANSTVWWVLTARGEPLLSLEAKGIYNRVATARFEHIPVANRANINDFRRWWRRSLVGRSRSLGRDNKGGKYWWCWWVRCCPITFFLPLYKRLLSSCWLLSMASSSRSSLRSKIASIIFQPEGLLHNSNCLSNTCRKELNNYGTEERIVEL